MIFKDRAQAGLLLAKNLKLFKSKNAVVLGIPRGGVVVANAVAKSLHLPLDLIVIKKIGAPYNPELAIGAVGPPATQAELAKALRAGPKSVIYWDEKLCQSLGINDRTRNKELRIKEKEREEREKILRGKKVYKLENKTVILVDDGVATGATVLTACKYLRTQKIKRVILAVPMISKETLGNIKQYFDNVVVLSTEEDFMAVGQFYLDFPQVSDQEVIDIINSLL